MVRSGSGWRVADGAHRPTGVVEYVDDVVRPRTDRRNGFAVTSPPADVNFPDTSLHALLLLMGAGLVTGLVGTALRDAFGDPTTWWGNVLLVFVAYSMGVAVVYGTYLLEGYRSTAGGSRGS